MSQLIVVLVILVMILSASITVVKEYERVAVFRLGRFVGIKGPGVILVIPTIDKCVRVNVREKIPGWQEMSKQELEERVKAIVTEESGVKP